jgi:cysteine desulfurase
MVIFEISIYNMPEITYLDYNATTPLDPRVLDAIMPYLKEDFGNASSRHLLGSRAHQAVKKARTSVAELIKCEDYEVIFTSGATEAINLAIKGILELSNEKRNQIITVCTEHPAVLDTCKYLASKGIETIYLPVRKDGLLELDTVKKAVTEKTILVSVMYVNNETGVIQPLKQISDIAHEKGAYFMTDATQALGKISINVNEIGIDILSMSGHKIYGPKGIGALFIRSRRPNKVRIEPILHGGGQERNIRSGTLNTFGIIGLAKACEIAKKEMHVNTKYIKELREYLEMGLLKIDNTFVNGSIEQRIYNTSSICFKGADSDAIIVGLKDICVSNGSACSSNSFEPSHVLKGMGYSDEEAFSTIRFSLGKFNTLEDVMKSVKQIKEIVERLRSMNNNE